MNKILQKRINIARMSCLFVLLFLGIGSYSAMAQEKIITGTVTSPDGMGLPGVNVIQKGTSNGATTDFDGKYSMKLVQGTRTLVYSFIGFKTKEISVEKNTVINVVLDEDAQSLDEVVVVGYGSVKKVNLTGAVGVAKGEVLENRPIATVGQGLQGVIPGLNITVQNGDPSQNVEFNIRGFESINGGSPLILVDNIPMNLNQLNPNDIESFTVLKDAAASAIYGARAAFGVILVTTKKGKKGRINVTLSTEQSIAKPIFYIDPVNDPYTYVTTLNNIALDEGNTPPFDADYVAGTLAYSQNPTKENEWGVKDGILQYYGFNNYQRKVITDSSPQKKYDLSVSGSTENTSFYASFGYLGKKGFLVNDDKNQNFERFNALLKADTKINKWLSLDQKIIYSNTTSDEPHTYAFDASLNSVARLEPNQMLEFPDLEYYLTPGDRDLYEQYIGMAFFNQNSLPYINNGGRDRSTQHNLWLTQGITLNPLEGLVIKGDFSYNTTFNSIENVASKIEVINTPDLNNIQINNGFSANDYVLNQNNYNQQFVVNAYAEYTYDKIKDHFIKGMVGFNQEELRTKRLLGRAANLITPGITDLDVTTGDQTIGGGRAHYALRGAFFRLNYNYRDKYLVEANGRYDGSSRFPKKDRFGFFPSFSLAWKISEESFMSSTEDWLDNLKLRASYGELGNQISSSYYPYVPSLSSNSSVFIMNSGYTPYVSAAGLVSPTLTWESVNTRNIGMDFTLLNGKLDVSADAYIRETKDMLLGVNRPDVLGANAPKENGADLETKGWEITATWRDNINDDWSYGITAVVSDNQSKITKYAGDNPNVNGYYVGKKLGEIWGFETVGIFQTDEDALAAPPQNQVNGAVWKAGDIQYADLNEDGIINRGTSTVEDHGDLKVIGNNTARYAFGIRPNIKYKAFSCDLFLQGLFRDYLPSNAPHAAFYPYNSQIVENYYLTDTWAPDRPDAYFGRPAGGIKNIQPQSRFIQNAAYIRLKSLTFNYNVPQDIVTKLGMTTAQLYLSGQNLGEFTNMRKPLDPEQATQGSLNQQYYFERTFSLGVKVAF